MYSGSPEKEGEFGADSQTQTNPALTSAPAETQGVCFGEAVMEVTGRGAWGLGG